MTERFLFKVYFEITLAVLLILLTEVLLTLKAAIQIHVEPLWVIDLTLTQKALSHTS